MNFRLSYASHTVLSDLDHQFVYAYGSPDRVEVRIRSEAARGILCSATGHRVPPADAMLVFSDIEQRRVPSGSPDSRAWQGCLDESGLIRENVRFPVEFLPKRFQDFWKEMRSLLADHLDRTRRVLEWRTGTAGSQRSNDRVGIMEWSRDGLSWRTFEGHIQARLVEVRSVPSVNADVLQRVQEWVAEGRDVPLAHELFGEAWSQHFEHPRGALVIGIAAAEIAFKQYVIGVVPDAEWLVEELPTPPLGRMLRKYLPKLRARQIAPAEVRPLPKSLLRSLECGVELRNKIVHSRAEEPATELVSKVLTAVEDLLWLLDSYQGFGGALEFVSYDVRKQL